MDVIPLIYTRQNQWRTVSKKIINWHIMYFSIFVLYQNMRRYINSVTSRFHFEKRNFKWRISSPCITAGCLVWGVTWRRPPRGCRPSCGGHRSASPAPPAATRPSGPGGDGGASWWYYLWTKSDRGLFWKESWGCTMHCNVWGSMKT